ncbi:hypothetical protein I302_100294 [Kwoniella bestiolae CBS 10118]|uniref:Uncharacterized protein n=1 Tax=Kwoniella bestiolae CBS 10118 TaxID=1296100 RepID=A0A1B9G4R8_9TREE|nr:hypothetical protein I302_03665 [Kwoniella bestiolae CBS 10118]OCF25988.1 hypothetical protein I302_03665 [Kwoniella bestiolae CBS 10118]
MLEPIISNLLSGRDHLMGIDVDLDVGRIALADQVTRGDDDVWISIVNVVILCLTILGSGMILVSMFYLEWYRGRPGTTRTRIVQALIVSDFLLGIVGLISSCIFLSGDGSALAHGTPSCDGLGLLLTAILWTEHGWTLILAVATFMILIYPLHWFTLWMEQRWYYLWAFVWIISIAIGVMGYELYGFYPSGGTCFYGANAGLYSELMQFIPRCVVCIGITVLYARLYVFLKRPDKIRIPGSNSATGGQYETVSSSSNKEKGDLRERLGSLMNGPFRKKRGSSGEALSPLPEGQSQSNSDSSQNSSRQAQQPVRLSPINIEMKEEPTKKTSGIRRPSFSPTKEIPPWEKLELPAFQVDGERFGGPSPSVHSPSIWSGWKGGRKRSSTTTVSTSAHTNVNSPSSRLNSISNSIKYQNQNQQQQQNTNPTQAQDSSQNSKNLKATPPGLYVPRMPSIPSEDIMEPTNLNKAQHLRQSTDDTFIAAPSIMSSSVGGEKKRKKSVQLPSSSQSISSSPEIGNSPKFDRQRPSVTISEGIELDSTRLSQPENQNEARSDTSPPLTLPKIALPPRIDNPWSLNGVGGRRSAPTTPTFSQQNFQFNITPLGTPDQKQPTVTATNSRRTSKNDRTDQIAKEEEEDNGDEEDEWDLARMLAQPPPGSHADDRFAPRQSATNGETYELVPESMSSYLNRKTALLMLWFPLGYLFLFSVSLIRLIYDFAGKPPTALRAISKWMILAQGVLDAVIYGVVEWHTKRVVRKRVRKGTFSPRTAGGATPNGSKMGLNGFMKNVTNRLTASAGVGGNSQTQSGSNSKTEQRSSSQPNHNIGTTSMTSAHGLGGYQSQTSSYHIPEEEDPKSSSGNKNKKHPAAHGWNHEFSMGSIREGIPSPTIEEITRAGRKGSESPLGGGVGPSSPRI